MILFHQARGFSLTGALQQRLETRIWHGLGHLAPRVVEARVRLDDINGPHGGQDKRCSIVAKLTERRTLVARAIHRDLYAAIDMAAERIRSAAERVVRRRSSRERKGLHRPSAAWSNRPSFNAPQRFGSSLPTGA
ncbi:MAG: HPF/RaiA family ribosome-associated protein [Phycisphaerae bacterium]